MDRIDGLLTIDGDQHEQLALFGAQLGDIDVDEADGVAIERLLRRVALELGQATDAVALEAAVQR